MAVERVGLSPSQLATAFPFHLVIDPLFRIRQVGDGLLRLCPAIRTGDRVEAHFRPLVPGGPGDFETLSTVPGETLVLDSRERALQLAGRVVDLGPLEGTLILAEPRVAGTERQSEPSASESLTARALRRLDRATRDAAERVLETVAFSLTTERDPELQDQLNAISSSAREVLETAERVTDLVALESGALALSDTPFRLRDRVNEAVRPLAERAFERELELAVHIAQEVPDSLLGDGARLGQVIANLVDNAVRCTDQGEVVVRVTTAERGEASVVLQVEVSDTGPGIPSGLRAVLFDAAATGQTGGGVGLVLCAKLVALMGGRIWARSEPARGTTVGFTVRVGVMERVLTGLPPHFAGAQVLVADDSATSRRVLVDLLLGWGLRPVTAEDGPSALAAIRGATLAGRPFSLALLDTDMPVLGGVPLARQIHDDDALGRLPVVLLRPSPSPEEQPSPVPGVVASLSKPVSVHELLAALRVALRVEGGASQAPATPPLRLVDPDAALARVDGDRALLSGIVRLFHQRAPRLLGKLRRGVVLRDARSLEREAHTLRGLLSSLAADGLARETLRVERFASAGDLSAAGLALTAVERGVQQVRAELVPLVEGGRRRQVLVAEDEAVTRTMLEATLRHGGYDVVVARDGAEAWQALQGEDAPRLAVLDWLMPGLDGAAVCRRLRQRQRGPYTYVLMVTGRNRREDVVGALEAGADDFLTKPYDPQELRSRLRVGERALEREARHAAALAELRDELDQVPHLRGLLPICMYCKRIRDEHHAWHRLEEYIERYSQTTFTHSICEPCLEANYHG